MSLRRPCMILLVVLGICALFQISIAGENTKETTYTDSVNENQTLEKNEIGLYELIPPEETVLPLDADLQEPEILISYRSVALLAAAKPKETVEVLEKDESESIDETAEPDKEEKVQEEEKPKFVWDGPKLTARLGTIEGPSGKETYYNLPMKRVVQIMHEKGFEGEYWVREDGVKMFGEYVMCAANLNIRPKGTILETSLGTAIVCDTGDFAKRNKTQIDIAVAW